MNTFTSSKKKVINLLSCASPGYNFILSSLPNSGMSSIQEVSVLLSLFIRKTRLKVFKEQNNSTVASRNTDI